MCNNSEPAALLVCNRNTQKPVTFNNSLSKIARNFASSIELTVTVRILVLGSANSFLAMGKLAFAEKLWRAFWSRMWLVLRKSDIRQRNFYANNIVCWIWFYGKWRKRKSLHTTLFWNRKNNMIFTASYFTRFFCRFRNKYWIRTHF